MVPQRILIADNNQENVHFLLACLSQANYQVNSTGDGKTAMQMLRREQTDLLIVDLNLADQSGLDLIRGIRNDPAMHDLPIMVLTTQIDATENVVSLELGADDYITKPFNLRLLLVRIRSVLRRCNAENNNLLLVLSCYDLRLDTVRHEVSVRGQMADLTLIEFNLLKTLMNDPGYVFSRNQLIELVWGYDSESTERTIDVHIKNMRRKLEPNPKQPIYIETVFGFGYRAVCSSGLFDDLHSIPRQYQAAHDISESYQR